MSVNLTGSRTCSRRGSLFVDSGGIVSGIMETFREKFVVDVRSLGEIFVEAKQNSPESVMNNSKELLTAHK